MTTMTEINISAAKVKELRDKTGAPMMDCKKALTEAKGDMEQASFCCASEELRLRERKAGRATSEGSVASYIHAGGKIGVLVEVNCESDFVARTDDFSELVHDIAMHIAASDPKFVRKEDVTPEPSSARRTSIAPKQKRAARSRRSQKRWLQEGWQSSTKKFACWNSRSSRTRRSRSAS